MQLTQHNFVASHSAVTFDKVIAGDLLVLPLSETVGKRRAI